MGSPLGTALFEALGGGNNYKNQLAGALAAGRLGSMKSTERYNTLRGDAQYTANRGMEDLLDLHPLDKKDPMSEAIRNTNPHASALANAKRAFANIGNDSLNATALSGANNALAGSRNADANQINFQTDTAKTGFESLLNDPNMSDTLKSFIQINATNQTGGGLVALLNSPDVQAYLRSRVKTEGSKQDVNKAKKGTEGSKQDLYVKKGNVQDSIVDVNKAKKDTEKSKQGFNKLRGDLVTENIGLVHEKIKLLAPESQAKIGLLGAEVDKIEAEISAIANKSDNLDMTTDAILEKYDAQIKNLGKIGLKTDEEIKIATEIIEKQKQATLYLKAKITNELGGKSIDVNKFFAKTMDFATKLSNSRLKNGEGESIRRGTIKSLMDEAFKASLQVLEQIPNAPGAGDLNPVVQGLGGGATAPAAPAPLIADVPTSPLALGLGGGAEVSTPQSPVKKLNSGQINALAKMQSGQLSQLRAEALAAGNIDLVNMIDQQLGK